MPKQGTLKYFRENEILCYGQHWKSNRFLFLFIGLETINNLRQNEGCCP